MTQAVARISEWRRQGQPPVRLLARAAETQQGLITYDQLLECGLSASAVLRLVAKGWLIRLHEGVYATRGAPLTREARWLAAVFASGPAALLSHLSAGALWNAIDGGLGDPHVTLESTGRAGHPGIATHRMRRMHEDDFARVEGIPVTSLELTCLHLAPLLSRPAYQRAVIRAARRPEFSALRAHELLERSNGRPGVRKFRAVVARDLTAEMRALSELESRFIELLRRHRIPLPEINRDVESFMVDAVWHAARLIVELDGFEFHKLPRDLRRANERTRRLVLGGYRVIRFTWSDVTQQPQSTVATVRSLLERSHGGWS